MPLAQAFSREQSVAGGTSREAAGRGKPVSRHCEPAGGFPRSYGDESPAPE